MSPLHRSRTACSALLALAVSAVTGWAGESTSVGCKIVATFDSFPGDPHPVGSELFIGHDNRLHGITPGGWAQPPGAAFRMTFGGQLSALALFADRPGPRGQVTASDGNYYGVTYGEAFEDAGSVYRMRPNGDVKTLHNFRPWPHCSRPVGRLLQTADGALYGIGSGKPGICAFKLQLDGQFTLLHFFDASQAGDTGMRPFIQAADGLLYTTAFYGGSAGLGTVLAMQLDGRVRVLHSFQGGAADGAMPETSLVEGPDGWLYGTTYGGGAHGLGVFYRISRDGDFSVLHSFGYDDGLFFRVGDLLLARDGHFYGVMGVGGPHDNGGVYRLTEGGDFAVIHAFGARGTHCGVYAASSGLVEWADGEFYGTHYGETPINGNGSDVPGAIYRIRVR